MPWTVIRDVSDRVNLPIDLVGAVVRQESFGDHFAARYESHYRYTVDTARFAKLNRISEKTELEHQKTSWGLLQIMGGTARDIGYKGALVGLTVPEVGLYWGAKFLKRLVDKYDHLDDAIAAYNAGSPRKDANGKYVNQYYVDSVRKWMSDLQ